MAHATGQQPVYCWRDLGLLAGDEPSDATAVNDHGDVAVNSLSGQAFVFHDGRLRPIAPLPGDDLAAVSAINAAGVIAGNSVNSRGDTANHPFTHHDGRTLPIIGLADAIPYAINDKDEIAGGSRELGAFLYRQGSVSALGRQGSVAYAINNRGDVVGVSDAGQAFLFRGGTMRPMGTLRGHDYSEARDISETGRIVGFSGRLGLSDGEAFIATEAEGMRGLGKLAESDTFSIALSIDPRGLAVVGCSGSSADLFGLTGLRAFLFKDERMFDLNALIASSQGVTLTVAAAINDRGQIAAHGVHNGRLHAFLVTPKREDEPCDPSAPSP
jgi:probable HAF family extracellular repeat protein